LHLLSNVRVTVLNIKVREGLELEVSGKSPVEAFLRELIFV
jgi:hypothetical protein